jgi:hypothetical protein
VEDLTANDESMMCNRRIADLHMLTWQRDKLAGDTQMLQVAPQANELGEGRIVLWGMVGSRLQLIVFSTLACNLSGPSPKPILSKRRRLDERRRDL